MLIKIYLSVNETPVQRELNNHQQTQDNTYTLIKQCAGFLTTQTQHHNHQRPELVFLLFAIIVVDVLKLFVEILRSDCERGSGKIIPATLLLR